VKNIDFVMFIYDNFNDLAHNSLFTFDFKK